MSSTLSSTRKCDAGVLLATIAFLVATPKPLADTTQHQITPPAKRFLCCKTRLRGYFFSNTSFATVTAVIAFGQPA